MPVQEKQQSRMMIHEKVFDCIDAQWFIIHTMSNQEVALASAMQAMDVPYFLPLRRIVRDHGQQRKHVMAPLFPSYIFIRGDLDQVYRADRTKRVAHVVRVFDQDRLNAEIHDIHRVLLNDGIMAPHPFLKVGIRVEVSSGPFRGMRGLIESLSKDDRLILQVEALGQSTSLEIDGSLLEPIE